VGCADPDSYPSADLDEDESEPSKAQWFLPGSALIRYAVISEGCEPKPGREKARERLGLHANRPRKAK